MEAQHTPKDSQEDKETCITQEIFLCRFERSTGSWIRN